MVVTYGTMLAAAQSAVWGILSIDAAILAIITNVLDGVPTNLYKGVGFPYLIVPSPDVDERQDRLHCIRATIILELQCWAKKESVARELADAVRNALAMNRAAFKTAGLEFKTSTRINRGVLTFPDGSSAYNITVRVEAEWGGNV